MKSFITVSQAAEIHQTSVRNIRNYCEKGRIKGAVKYGRFWLLPLDFRISEVKLGRPPLPE